MTSETGSVYAKIVMERRSRKYTYVPTKAGHSFWRHGMVEMLPIEKLDQLVVDRLFYHIKSIKELPDYEEILQQKKAERQQALTHITQSLKSLLEQQDRLIKQMQKTEQESVRDILLRQIEELETEKKQLTQAKACYEQEYSHSLASFNEELQYLEEDWDDYPFDKRLALINLLVKSVSLDMMSPRWIRIRIQWDHEGWGCEQIYLLRDEEKASQWTDSEIDYLKEHLGEKSKDEIMEQLDTRTWQAIRKKGYDLGIIRRKQETSQKYAPHDANFCARDFHFMAEHCLTRHSTHTEWESPSYREALAYPVPSRKNAFATLKNIVTSLL